jgi:sugar lactone lactonase YvrE
VFISASRDLYVADFKNDRIQRFRPAERNGTTVAGVNASGTIALNGPSSVILDAGDHLFICDRNNHRIVGSSSLGFRCIVGCSGGGNSASHLLNPTIISFDSLGNLYVLDSSNNRVQRFDLISITTSK